MKDVVEFSWYVHKSAHVMMVERQIRLSLKEMLDVL